MSPIADVGAGSCVRRDGDQIERIRVRNEGIRFPVTRIKFRRQYKEGRQRGHTVDNLGIIFK